MSEAAGEESGGLSANEAFALLADETRMAILSELWDADGPVGFSALRGRVGGPDSGNFNYHLSKLVGSFVVQDDGGYSLREAGKSIVRALLSGVITADRSTAPTEVDEQCPYCGASVVFSFEDDRLTVRCSSCPGVVEGEDYPRGTFMSYAFPPAGLEDRSLEAVIDAAHAFYDGKITPMMSGVCPECAGRTSVEIDICRDHDDAGDRLCSACGTRYKVWSEYRCAHCDYRRRSALWFKLMNHSAVVAFFHEVGGLNKFIPLRKLTSENARYVSDIRETVVAEDPLRIRVDICLEGERLQVTVDEALDVVEITR